MVERTPNHELNMYSQGDNNWTHTPDMETIEKRMWVRDVNTNRNTYEAYVNALFLATDTGDVYIGNGSDWGDPIGRISASNDGNGKVNGITGKHDHIGPFHHGEYRDIDGPNGDDPRMGIMIWAREGLTIHSAVVDSNLSDINTNQIEVQLTEYKDGAANPPIIDTTVVSLTGGPQRINLGFTIPSDGEYVITRDYAQDGDAIVPLRRIRNWNGWEDYTRDDIDLRSGTHIGTDGDWGGEEGYYYFFDIEIGAEITRVTSPWSHDVEEIYMRPRDPEEEFDNVSPRSLWIDTSQQ